MKPVKFSPKIITVGVVFITLLLSLKPIDNYDIWWHLKSGELIYSNLNIPHEDPFSYTKSGGRWLDHEWLSQVIYYLSYKLFDLYGVILVKFLVLGASFLVIYKRNKLFLDEYFNISSIVLIAVISQILWIARPTIFILFFVPLALYLLDSYLIRGKNRIWFFPLLMIVWVNLHGSFILGLGLLLLYAFNSLIREKEKGLFLFKIFGVSLLATLVNPYTYEILFYPFQYITQSVHALYIAEWQSPSFHSFSPFEVGLLLSLVVLAYSRKVDHFDLLLILIFTHLSLFALRNTALYAVVAVPLIFKYAQPFVKEKLSLDLEKLRNRAELFLSSFFPAFLLMGVVLFFTTLIPPLQESPADYSNLPLNASNYLLENKENLSHHNIFNVYHWGGYLIWRLYPDYRVFIDGRADLYGDFLKEYHKVTHLKPGMDRVLSKYNVSLIIIQEDSPLDIYLKGNQKWNPLYSDNTSVIYIENHSGEN